MRRYQVIFAFALVVACCAGAEAQRSRAVTQSQVSPNASPTPTPAPAPASLKAKYEGGVAAFTRKQTGTLNFDDAGQRLIFKDKYQREYLSLPYKSFSAIWGDTRAVTSNAARVVGAVPIYGIGLTSLLMPKNKQRYFVVQFDDPDTKINGTTSFKLENKEVLASVLSTLAQKTGMKARGDGFIRDAQATSKP
ncbi:MAG: hypothetical protein QOE33_3089 [Acidobacteriota bacterium]|nr:hypothetical protein [Acidobacteriota bacterium]